MNDTISEQEELPNRLLWPQTNVFLRYLRSRYSLEYQCFEMLDNISFHPWQNLEIIQNALMVCLAAAGPKTGGLAHVFSSLTSLKQEVN
jgi:hypothetical protein